MNKRLETLFALLFAAGMFAFVISGCTNDPDADRVTHYYYPVWSPDGNVVVFGFQNFREASYDSAAAPNVMFRSSAMQTIIHDAYHVMDFPPRARCWFEPKGKLIAVAGSGMHFYNTLGKFKGDFIPLGTSVKPTLIAFQEGGGAYLWAGMDGDHIVIGRAEYINDPWITTRQTVLKDTVFSGSVLDIAITSSITYAIHMTGGVIFEYNHSGDMLGRFNTKPRVFDNSWQGRIHFVDFMNRRQLFALDDSGIVVIDFESMTKKVITYGRVVNYDVSGPSGTMVYETTSGDVWLATATGSPLARLAPHAVMPRLSPDGKVLAAVGPVTPKTDTLAIKRWIW
jgi:hypothetical protein